MEIIILGLICWFFWKYIPGLEAKDNIRPGSNPSLQMIYQIDEFYRLRLRFDDLIEEDWQKYRAGKISREQYEEASNKAAKEIVDDENTNNRLDKRVILDDSEFNTLFRIAVRRAAFRVTREGFNIGDDPYTRTKREIRCWFPSAWERDRGYRSRWRLCETSPYDILRLYPSMNRLILSYDVGKKDANGVWVHNTDLPPGCGSTVYGFPAEKKILYTSDLLVKRGYNGKTYLNEPPRSYGDLTEDEIAAKYEFIIDSRLNLASIVKVLREILPN